MVFFFHRMFTMLSIRTTILSFKNATAAAAWRIFRDTTCVTLPKFKESLQYSSVSRDMVDPKKVVSYEDMLKVVNQPETVIIDVRNPDEVSNTGKIPSSINIPCNMQEILSSMPEEQFKQQFQRPKPTPSDDIIFYCQSGRRSTEALDKALKMGYSNSKTYLGSWNDWSSRRNM